MRYITKQDILIVAKNSGRIMIGIGIMCLVPIIVDLIFLEFNAAYYLIPGIISIVLGFICTRFLNRYKTHKMRLKHAMIISSLSWLWACTICGLALHFITGINMIDASFESMSALTGSGITIYGDVESLPYSILFFRGFQQWIGGLGVVVMILSFLAKPGAITSKLYNSEARDERIKPSTATTLKYTFLIYFIFTSFGIILYTIAGMPIFDSICNTFSIISTGGMSIKNANMGFYQNDIIYLITIILMILGATSFLVHYKVFKYGLKSVTHDLQFKVMISIIAITTVIIYFASSIVPMDNIFVVVSAITTTGASIQSSTVMGGWPSFVIIIIMTLMIIGGSNGSTVGAIKLMRVIVFFKGLYKNVYEILSPMGRVVPLKVNGDKISDSVVAQSGNYITLYCICILITWSLLCFYKHDPFNSLFFAISMQGNVGLEIGQMSQVIEWPIKLVGMLNMWSGRLEIYPLLITLRALFEIFR